MITPGDYTRWGGDIQIGIGHEGSGGTSEVTVLLGPSAVAAELIARDIAHTALRLQRFGNDPPIHRKRRRLKMDRINNAAETSDALVLFGATGDLAYKKIFPALYALVKKVSLNVPVVGVASSPW